MCHHVRLRVGIQGELDASLSSPVAWRLPEARVGSVLLTGVSPAPTTEAGTAVGTE